MIVLSAADVAELLDLDELVDAVEAAMIDLSFGRASAPPRIAARTDSPPGLLFAMPASVPSIGALAAKLVTQFPDNRERPAHQAMVCVFDPADGTPLAVMDGEYLTAARTAAGSALAARLLAHPDAREAAVLGTGVQAAAQARAIARLPGIEVVRIAGRDRERADRLVGRLTGQVTDSRAQRGAQPRADEPTGGVARIEAAESIEHAVRDADIVCAATHAAQPVVLREWLRPHAHVNSVGYNTAGAGELDTATVLAALLVVESREAALAEPPAGAIELAGVAPSSVLEIGEVAADPDRADRHALTLYKSVGVAVQDAAAASLVLRAAARRDT